MVAGSMPAFAGNTTDGERWDVVNYILSIARIAPWESGGQLAGPGQQSDLTRRGAYLVHAEMCGLCHTMIDRSGIYRGDDYYLAGGMRCGGVSSWCPRQPQSHIRYRNWPRQLERVSNRQCAAERSCRGPRVEYVRHAVDLLAQLAE